MPTHRIILESHCDRAKYVLPSPPEGPIARVAFREFDAPVLSNGKRLELKVHAALDYLQVVNEGFELDTVNTAFWFVRAAYEHCKKPTWHYHGQSNTLIIFPPPPNDGDMVILEWDEPNEQKPD